VKVVFDTCVVVSALRSSSGASFRLLERVIDGSLRLQVSTALMLEYEEVLCRAGMVPLAFSEVIDFLDAVAALADWVDIRYRLRPLADDPGDDMVVECAYNADAVLVTHNLRDFEGARPAVLVTPPSAVLRYLEKKR
jgi:putative PIN family toxin of toxin-antitoxin system